MKHGKLTTLLLGSAAVWSLLAPSAAEAGCGCAKAPPPPAAVRPAFTYAGAPVTIFGDALVPGASYRVIFASGVAPATAAVDAAAVVRRDLADGVKKPQLVVPLPNLPLGPVRIEVSDAAGNLMLALGDDAFTAVPMPVLVPEDFGGVLEQQRAAVGRDGTTYLSLDLSGLLAARTIDISGQGLPLRFGTEDVLIYNTQGFLMQTLTTPIPGLVTFATTDRKGVNSDVIRYFRHEFETYYLEHGERNVHPVDPSDASWHQDGTPHIDHDHLVVAIDGTLNGAVPAPGATDSFRVQIKVLSEDASSSTSPKTMSGSSTTTTTTKTKMSSAK
jgi:hypothetical protein